MNPVLSTAIGFGFLLGLRHALEADHLVSVAALAHDRRGTGAGLRTGLLWGIGHTLAILLVGALVILCHWSIGDRSTRCLEFGAAFVIVLLGARLLYAGLAEGRVHRHPHAHGDRVHSHVHLHDRRLRHGHAHGVEAAGNTPEWRLPLLVGAVHGLAGSALPTLLAATTFSSALSGMSFLLLFGLGSVLGMGLMSVTISGPLMRLGDRLAAWHRPVRLAAALGTIGFGLVLGWRLASRALLAAA